MANKSAGTIQKQRTGSLEVQEALGQSEAFLEFQERLSRVAPVDRPVLLLGERGTGKELAATRLHFLSRRWQGPLVALNCAALAPTLIDYAGAGIPGVFQGSSLKPLIEDKAGESWRKSFFYHYYGQFDVPEHWGIRTEEHKLIRFPRGDTSYWELYDLAVDPAEMINQAGNPVYQSLSDSLKVVLKMEKERFEDQ